MQQATAKVIRITSDTDFAQVMNVAAIQVIGGTAVTTLYDGAATAANTKASIVATAPGVFRQFNHPIRFSSLNVDLGAGVTACYIHVV